MKTEVVNKLRINVSDRAKGILPYTINKATGELSEIVIARNESKWSHEPIRVFWLDAEEAKKAMELSEKFQELRRAELQMMELRKELFRAVMIEGKFLNLKDKSEQNG